MNKFENSVKWLTLFGINAIGMLLISSAILAGFIEYLTISISNTISIAMLLCCVWISIQCFFMVLTRLYLITQGTNVKYITECEALGKQTKEVNKKYIPFVLRVLS